MLWRNMLYTELDRLNGSENHKTLHEFRNPFNWLLSFQRLRRRIVSIDMAMFINLCRSQVVMAMGQWLFKNTWKSYKLQIDSYQLHSIISHRCYIHKKIISTHQKGSISFKYLLNCHKLLVKKTLNTWFNTLFSKSHGQHAHVPKSLKCAEQVCLWNVHTCETETGISRGYNGGQWFHSLNPLWTWARYRFRSQSTVWMNH